MALISAGTQVTITDQSLFIPSGGVTIPLIILATKEHKTAADNITNAPGTFESNVVRTITSVKNSLDMFGIPRFLTDSSGNPHHGDCRNEYGLVALNQHLGVAGRAYTIRANVNLDDDLASLRTLWDTSMVSAGNTLITLINTFIDSYNTTNLLTPIDVGYKTTVTGSEAKSLIREATASVFALYSFTSTMNRFLLDVTSSPFLVFANGYSAASTGSYIGLDGIINDWVANNLGSTIGHTSEFTAAEAENILLAATDDYKFTREFRDDTSLGANDSVRRSKIQIALQAVLASNSDIRSENYEYNLIVCPGFPEVTDDLVALGQDIMEEAFVIGDTPMNLSPSDLVNTWSVSVQKRSSNNLAYYYPPVKVTNVDGNDVLVPASVAALRTYSYSDSVSEQWIAPAGTTRGLLASVSDIGYASGTMGGPTQFVQTYLNQGQRDDLYKYFTNINPIVFFPNRGILVWGQKTSANVASALDRVNVSRLIKFIKRQLRKNTLGFVFEPNDAITRGNAKAAVEGLLGDLVVRRGLYDYACLCDETNNTPDVIDNNILRLDVAIKPVKSAEFIEIPVRIVSTGAAI